MEVTLLPDERIDDLQCKGGKIIQNPKYFCFGIDAVLLANFAKIRKNSIGADLGSGNGIIAILAALKKPLLRIHAVELQAHMAEMAERSVILNQLQEKITVNNIDMKDAPGILGKNSMDFIMTNPPYTNKGTGLINPEDSKALARHEIACTLEDVVKVCFDLLKVRGKLFMVHRPDRLVDVVCMMRKYGMEPKYLRFVHPKAGQKPSMMLIEAMKGGGSELKVLEPLYVYSEDGSYTDEIMDIYYGGQDGNK